MGDTENETVKNKYISSGIILEIVQNNHVGSESQVV